MKFNHFVWDYDGTLFDTYDAVTKAYHRAVTKLGIDITFEELRWMTKHSLGWTAKQLEEKYGVSAEEILATCLKLVVDEFHTERDLDDTIRAVRKVCAYYQSK